MCDDLRMGHSVSVEDLTKLLNAASDGDAAALDHAWRAIHAEIHGMAARACSAEGGRAHLQPTLVVNELFLKLHGPGVTPTVWDDRRHFWGSVGRALGQFLIDLARNEGRLRRGGDRRRLPLEVVAGDLEDVTRALSPLAIVAIEALDRLEAEGRVVLRYTDREGRVTDAGNPNGSARNIAGVFNARRNVLGMMPHPENAIEALLGSVDGRKLFEGLVEAVAR